MDKKTYIILGGIMLVGITCAWFLQDARSVNNANGTEVSYQCDNNKYITAVYFEGPIAPDPEPGEPPTPTGSVTISLDTDVTITLDQTISGSGVRYANLDESFVFWNKGNEAILMRNNEMDLEYTNCREM